MLNAAGIYPSRAGFKGADYVGFKLFEHRRCNEPFDYDGMADLIKTSTMDWGDLVIRTKQRKYRHSFTQRSNLPNLSATDSGGDT